MDKCAANVKGHIFYHNTALQHRLVTTTLLESTYSPYPYYMKVKLVRSSTDCPSNNAPTCEESQGIVLSHLQNLAKRRRK